MPDHSTTPELFYGGQWNTAPAYTRDGITISRGAPGEGQEAPPSTASLTLDNRDGDANPYNPTSPLFGAAGRNTPLRITADGSVRSTTEAASWKPGRAIKGDRWTNLTGGGILRRLQQGKTPLKSPLVRAVTALTPVAYWPLTDGTDSDSAASGLPGGVAMVEAGAVGFAAVTGPPGAVEATPELVGDGVFLGELYAPVTMSGGEFTVDVWFRMVASADPADVVLASWRTDGTWAPMGWRLVATFFGGEYFVTLGRLHGGGSTLIGGSSELGGSPGDWHHFRVVAGQSGGNVDVEVFHDGESVATSSSAGTVGNVTQLWVGNYSDPIGWGVEPVDVESASVAHVSVWATVDPADLPAYEAGIGFAGELAGDRFLRLGVEEGVTTLVDGDETDTQAMGPQPSATLVDLLRECVRTDAGLMHEPRDQLGVAMRPGRSLYNQAPALELSFAGEHIAPPFVPVIDDLPVRNDVTAQRRGGSSARAVQETGPLNVQDPVDDPQGVGRVDTKIDVNTASDAVLLDHATWHLHKGTVDEPRYPAVTVDMDAPGMTPALAAAVDAVKIGGRVLVDDMEVDEAPDGVDQLVIGIRESMPAKRRLVTFVMTPASPFEVGLVGEDDGSSDLRGQAVPTDNSTLAADVGQYATTLSVASTGGVLWTTDSDDWNPALNGGGLLIKIGGETMRVTNITGASSPQTFTVVRSINGVVKPHLSGAPVHARYPTVVGL